MKTPIIVHPDLVIFEDNGRFWSLDQNGLRELEVVLTLDEEAYSKLEDDEVLEQCQEDFDYSGEYGTLTRYCFWRVVEKDYPEFSHEVKTLINNLLTYAEDRFCAEDVYWFLGNTLYGVINLKEE